MYSSVMNTVIKLLSPENELIASMVGGGGGGGETP